MEVDDIVINGVLWKRSLLQDWSDSGDSESARPQMSEVDRINDNCKYGKVDVLINMIAA